MNNALPFTPEPNVIADVTVFFDKDTETFSYVVKDPDSVSCAVVDSVLNINYPSGTISHVASSSLAAAVPG